MFYMDFTWAAILSLVLMVLWAVLVCLGKEKVFALFAIAHGLLYMDCFVLQNHFHFEIAGIMLAISVVAALIKWLHSKKINWSKQLAMYLLISAVPVFLLVLVSI